MSRKLMKVVALLAVVGILVAACQPATPETVVETVIETVVVEKEGETIIETVVVEKEVVTEVTPVPVDKGLVEFGGFYPADSPWGRAFRMIGYRFESENPDCQFVYAEYPGVEGGQALELRAKEGNPVSISQAGGVTNTGSQASIQKQWESGLFYDLSEAMTGSAYGVDGATWLDTFNAAAQEYMITGEGQIGSLPYQQTQIIMWINQGIYNELGLETPTTWSQFLSNCEVLKENGIACVGGGGFNGYIGYWYDMIIYRLLGFEKMTALYQNTDPEITWDNTPEVVTAAEMLNDLIVNGYTAEGFVGGDFTAEQVAFFTGRSAHLFVGTWLVGEMKDSIPEGFEMSVAYFPAVDGYEDLTPYESAFGFINAMSVYNPGANEVEPHSLECAVRFAKLITSPEVQEELSSGSNLDYVTAIIGGQGPSGIPGIGELLDGMQEWFPFMAGATYLTAEASSRYWDNVANLAAGGLTPEEFATKMAEDWADIYSRVE